ncbi:hypothetical protein F5884DRAFT_306351 [Xylogone sp. PMI_703]|nr:hypothetical protein F5884DRAFT_306351 [Xylogone sp. PMI_703]
MLCYHVSVSIKAEAMDHMAPTTCTAVEALSLAESWIGHMPERIAGTGLGDDSSGRLSSMQHGSWRVRQRQRMIIAGSMARTVNRNSRDGASGRALYFACRTRQVHLLRGITVQYHSVPGARKGSGSEGAGHHSSSRGTRHNCSYHSLVVPVLSILSFCAIYRSAFALHLFSFSSHCCW